MLGSSGQTKGNYAESGYAAAAGYDQASGLGTVDVANLIANWPTATFLPNTTTLNIAPAAFAHGTAVTVTATVAPSTGSGTPTGSVALNSTDAVAYSNALGVFSLAGGAVSSQIDNLPGGTYQVIGAYSGDSTYGASASAPVTVTVTPEKDTLNVSGWVVNPTDGNLYPLQAGMSIPYGAEVSLDAVPVGVNEVNPALGQNTPATGAINFTDTAGTATKTAAVPLNSGGPGGVGAFADRRQSYPQRDVYGRRELQCIQCGRLPLRSRFSRGRRRSTFRPMETSVAAGSNVTVDLLIYSDVLLLNGQLPAGTISVTLGGQTQTASSPFKSWGTTGSAVEEAVVTFPAVQAGILPLTATYSGDANWFGTSTLFGSVESLATKPAPAMALTSTATSYTPESDRQPGRHSNWNRGSGRAQRICVRHLGGREFLFKCCAGGNFGDDRGLDAGLSGVANGERGQYIHRHLSWRHELFGAVVRSTHGYIQCERLLASYDNPGGGCRAGEDGNRDGGHYTGQLLQRNGGDYLLRASRNHMLPGGGFSNRRRGGYGCDHDFGCGGRWPGEPILRW